MSHHGNSPTEDYRPPRPRHRPRYPEPDLCGEPFTVVCSRCGKEWGTCKHSSNKPKRDEINVHNWLCGVGLGIGIGYLIGTM